MVGAYRFASGSPSDWVRSSAPAAIVRIDFGGVNMLSLHGVVYVLKGITAVPFCLGLAVAALRVRRNDTPDVARSPASYQVPGSGSNAP